MSERAVCVLCGDRIQNYEEQARAWRDGLAHDSCIVDALLKKRPELNEGPKGEPRNEDA